MMPVPSHRKRVQHYENSGDIHELTFSCYQRFPLLEDNHRKCMFSEALDRAVEKQNFSLVAFVYMPEHVHLAVFPRDASASISRLLAAIKRPFSWQVKQAMLASNDQWLNRLVIRERPGKKTFRFWQEGPGYDRNINNAASLRKALDYIHANPVRRGLCRTVSEWRWSSWSHYHGQMAKGDDLPAVDGWPKGW